MKIITSAIALGMVVMILSVAIIVGFKQEIRNKIAGFNGHILINNYDDNFSYETLPISKKQPFYPSIKNNKGIAHIQTFATKPCIIKTKNEIQGVVLKGIGADFDWSFFEPNLIEGKIQKYSDSTLSNNVIISKHIASLLNLNIKDTFRIYFVQDPPRARKFNITGIYETGLEEFDKLFIICDLKHIQKLNNWTDEQVSGFEIFIDDYKQIDQMTDLVKNETGMIFLNDGSSLRIQNIKETNPQIFDWLNLLDANVWVILILMSIVATFNIVSGLLILILERTHTIGLLKALGTTNLSIRKIFMFQAMIFVGKGLLLGNFIGIAVCIIQHKFGVVALDPESYYVNTVPINLKISHLIILNTGTILITILFLIIPSMIISKIMPDKAIRFE